MADTLELCDAVANELPTRASTYVCIDGEYVNLEKLAEDAGRYRNIRDTMNAETLMYIVNNANTVDEFDDMVDDLFSVQTAVIFV
jgi:hypothetical protein